MPLIPCPQCKNSISSFANQCPHCGTNFKPNEQLSKENWTAKLVMVFGLLLLAVVLTIFAFYFSGTNKNLAVNNKKAGSNEHTKWVRSINLAQESEDKIKPLATARFWNRWLAIWDYDFDMEAQLLEEKITGREGLYLSMTIMQTDIGERKSQLAANPILDEDLVIIFQRHIKEDERRFMEYERLTSQVTEVEDIDKKSFRELAEASFDIKEKKRPADSRQQDLYFQRLRKYEEQRHAEIVELHGKLKKKYLNQTFSSPVEQGE